MANEKTRYLRIRSYNDPLPILEKKEKQIKRAIYIYHDKDNAQPHYHINLVLKDSRVPEEIRRWFVNTENPNAFCENDSGTFASAITYYKHLTESAIAENKYKYSDDEIQYFKCTSDDIESLDTDDASFSIICDILNGIPLLNIVEKYGKTFVRYYLSYRAIIRDIRDGQGSAAYLQADIDEHTGEIKPQ